MTRYTITHNLTLLFQVINNLKVVKNFEILVPMGYPIFRKNETLSFKDKIYTIIDVIHSPEKQTVTYMVKEGI